MTGRMQNNVYFCFAGFLFSGLLYSQPFLLLITGLSQMSRPNKKVQIYMYIRNVQGQRPISLYKRACNVTRSGDSQETLNECFIQGKGI